MQNFYTYFNNEKKRQKKTTILKCVERRTSDGKLISIKKSVKLIFIFILFF